MMRPERLPQSLQLDRAADALLKRIKASTSDLDANVSSTGNDINARAEVALEQIHRDVLANMHEPLADPDPTGERVERMVRDMASTYSKIKTSLFREKRFTTEHVPLYSGTTVQNHVTTGAYKNFIFDVKAPGPVTVELRVLDGDADLYCSTGDMYPTKEEHEFASAAEGDDIITVDYGNPAYKLGPLFISVYGKRASDFVIKVAALSHVEVKHASSIDGRVSAKHYNYYKFPMPDFHVALKMFFVLREGGKAQVVISNRTYFPTLLRCLWKTEIVGSGKYYIFHRDPNYRPGWFYIGITTASEECVYNLTCYAEKRDKQISVKPKQKRKVRKARRKLYERRQQPALPRDGELPESSSSSGSSEYSSDEFEDHALHGDGIENGKSLRRGRSRKDLTVEVAPAAGPSAAAALPHAGTEHPPLPHSPTRKTPKTPKTPRATPFEDEDPFDVLPEIRRREVKLKAFENKPKVQRRLEEMVSGALSDGPPPRLRDELVPSDDGGTLLPPVGRARRGSLPSSLGSGSPNARRAIPLRSPMEDARPYALQEAPSPPPAPAPVLPPTIELETPEQAQAAAAISVAAETAIKSREQAKVAIRSNLLYPAPVLSHSASDGKLYVSKVGRSKNAPPGAEPHGRKKAAAVKASLYFSAGASLPETRSPSPDAAAAAAAAAMPPLPARLPTIPSEARLAGPGPAAPVVVEAARAVARSGYAQLVGLEIRESNPFLTKRSVSASPVMRDGPWRPAPAPLLPSGAATAPPAAEGKPPRPPRPPRGASPDAIPTAPPASFGDTAIFGSTVNSMAADEAAALMIRSKTAEVLEEIRTRAEAEAAKAAADARRAAAAAAVRRISGDDPAEQAPTEYRHGTGAAKRIARPLPAKRRVPPRLTPSSEPSEPYPAVPWPPPPPADPPARARVPPVDEFPPPPPDAAPYSPVASRPGSRPSGESPLRSPPRRPPSRPAGAEASSLSPHRRPPSRPANPDGSPSPPRPASRPEASPPRPSSRPEDSPSPPRPASRPEQVPARPSGPETSPPRPASRPDRTGPPAAGPSKPAASPASPSRRRPSRQQAASSPPRTPTRAERRPSRPAAASSPPRTPTRPERRADSRGGKSPPKPPRPPQNPPDPQAAAATPQPPAPPSPRSSRDSSLSATSDRAAAPAARAPSRPPLALPDVDSPRSFSEGPRAWTLRGPDGETDSDRGGGGGLGRM